MFRRLFLLGAVLLLASCQSVSSRGVSAPPPEGQPIYLGAKHRLRSAILEEERGFSLYLPPGYAESSERYPVLYLLDGDAHFHHATGVVQFLAGNSHILPMIVVGVPNTNRTRELTPPVHGDTVMPGDTSSRSVARSLPTAGGADRFLRFLEEELAPYIEAHYRTQPYRILVGHSFGGLFAVHALMNRPQSFHAYIAISPSLWWNDGELVAGALKSLERLPEQERFLYMSMGDEGDEMLKPIQQLAATLEQARPARLAWRYAYLGNDHHGSTPHRTLYDGLEALFEDLRPQVLARTEDLAQLDARYARLTKRLGFELQPSEDLLNVVGYSLLQRGKVEAALAVFRRNVERHGDSANVHDSLGEALEAAGQLDAALESYRRALTLGIQANKVHPAYQQHVERVMRKLADAPKPLAPPVQTSGDGAR
ncbi:MAG TPA: alpha/beta fold hydrolase [Archangium sp.]|uniref:alpha/beta fold hydrolase n=1 Tax=Archangium sp. TaxID=1872627 RepID=UPI002E3724D2|nr:alpha/beta fold hydrolase [Archangium sp.]HEX5750084.1 alpha/beta fold hydrolase [Archangium sp.]